MSNDADVNFISAVLPAFISEAHEQLETIEQLLLQLETAPDDRELLDALFRCAHTVKGSAGIFGLDRVVDFTHHVESLLDRLREGAIRLTPTLSTLLLRSNDRIRMLVDTAADDTPPEPDEAADIAALALELQHAGGASMHAVAAGVPKAAVAVPVDSSSRTWHVSVHFGPETYRDGMDPLSTLNYLRSFGHIVALCCDVEAVPALESIDPETCHLGFKFGFETDASRDEIDAAFSFVREGLVLQLTEPGASAAAFIELIEALPQSARLGEILVSVGAVTREQLEHGLRTQAGRAADGSGAQRLGDILGSEAGLHESVVDAALEKQQRVREAGASMPVDDQRFIRVQADRLDAVINLLGELVTAGAGAALLARETRQGTLVEAHAQIGRLIEEIRNGTLQLRMVPIGETFARFRRVVRDTATKLGKEVVFEIVGGDAELDKSVVERIADPLMHLVRNALDHGLETAAQRTATGKPAQGRLTLTARHESGSILISIGDDGRGIDRPRVLARAWERGLVERGVTPSDGEIDKLIFEPGFSTAEAITDLSGRGVGMDVVRRNIEALRGSVTIHSETGTGSRIDIRLPLTLAIIDGFLVSVGASKFIIPLESVVEVIETRPSAESLDVHGRGFVSLRGQALPVVSLRTLYGLESPEPERVSVVVISAGASRYGVMVDQLLGQHQTVIKPLGRMFRSLRGMSGSSILGSGEVALIVEVHSLAGLAIDPPAARRAPGDVPPNPSNTTRSITEGQPS